MLLLHLDIHHLWWVPNAAVTPMQHFDTRYLGSAISHLPGFMSRLATQLGYSAGEFQALQLIVLAAFGVVD